MESLKRIESLSPATRSSFVGQRGVLDELRNLPVDEAISWLERTLASPVSRDWGRLLYALRADWNSLHRWLGLSKGHSLAAVDALFLYADCEEEGASLLPRGASAEQVIAAIAAAEIAFGNPRLRQSVEKIRSALGEHEADGSLSPSLSALIPAATILFGKDQSQISRWERQSKHAGAVSGEYLWVSLVHSSAGKYCVAVLDWKANSEEISAELFSLPIAKSRMIAVPSVSSSSSVSEFVKLAGSVFSPSGLSLASIQTGGDEYAFVVLPESDLLAVESAVAAAIGKPFSIGRAN